MQKLCKYIIFIYYIIYIYIYIYIKFYVIWSLWVSPRLCWTTSAARTTFRSMTSLSRMLRSSNQPMESSAPTASWETTSWHSSPRTTLQEKLDTWYGMPSMSHWDSKHSVHLRQMPRFVGKLGGERSGTRWKHRPGHARTRTPRKWRWHWWWWRGRRDGEWGPRGDRSTGQGVEEEHWGDSGRWCWHDRRKAESWTNQVWGRPTKYRSWSEGRVRQQHQRTTRGRRWTSCPRTRAGWRAARSEDQAAIVDGENDPSFHHPMYRHCSERRCHRQHGTSNRRDDSHIPEGSIQALPHLDINGARAAVLRSRQEDQAPAGIWRVHPLCRRDCGRRTEGTHGRATDCFFQRQRQERQNRWKGTGSLPERGERHQSTLQNHEVPRPDWDHSTTHLFQDRRRHRWTWRTTTRGSTGGIRLRQKDHLRCLRRAILRLLQSDTTSTRWSYSHRPCGVSMRSDREIPDLHHPRDAQQDRIWNYPNNCKEFGKGNSEPYNKALRRWRHAWGRLIQPNVKMPENTFEHLAMHNPQKNGLQRARRSPGCQEEAAQRMRSS